MKIANIIYEKELVNHVELEYVNYYKELIEYDKLDKTLPTLYVGWSFMKQCNPNNEIIQNANILHKKIISNELYWECSFDESKSSHVKGVENFINAVPQFYFLPKYTYINLDPVFFLIKDLQDLVDVLPKEIDAVYNFKNEMVYLLSENKITGIDLKMYGFFKFDVSKILSLLHNKSINIYNDLDGNIHMSYYKIFPNFTYLKRYLVTILSK
jgi:hypothetical protein